MQQKFKLKNINEIKLCNKTNEWNKLEDNQPNRFSRNLHMLIATFKISINNQKKY